MKRTILTLSLSLIAIFVSAQNERVGRRDSVAGNLSVPIKEAMSEIEFKEAMSEIGIKEAMPEIAIKEVLSEGKMEKPVQNSSVGTFYEPDFKDFSGELSLEAKPLEINPNAMPTKPETFMIPNIAMYSNYEEMCGFADIRRASFSYGWNAGQWAFEVKVSGEKYKFQDAAFDNFLLGGSATYHISPHWSLTAFGQYSTGRYLHSLAAYPYISQSQFGGTLNYHGERFGMRLGARQYYDPLRRQWQTEPIIAPQFKLGKMPVEVDFGPLARKVLERAIYGKRNDGPMIMPTGK